MPGTTIPRDIELIIENVGGGGAGSNPPPARGGDGDSDGKHKSSRPASPRRYYTGIAVAIVSILMFFMALVSAYVIRKASGTDWIPLRFPAIVWVNTSALLASSLTMEFARRRLLASDLPAFRRWWSVTSILGLFFLTGQLIVWRELVAQGVYVASNPASSFFYVFTGAHAVHVIGGVGALLFVAFRRFENAKVSRLTAVEVTSYFWHFLDALWLFLALVLYFGR
jgi:cytochrome c oxidase subunit III